MESDWNILEYVWNMYGVCMEYVLEYVLEYVWNMSGQCMEYVWNNVWKMSGSIPPADRPQSLQLPPRA